MTSLVYAVREPTPYMAKTVGSRNCVPTRVRKRRAKMAQLCQTRDSWQRRARPFSVRWGRLQVIDPAGTGGSETEEEQDDGVTPPAYLQEDLADLLVPPTPRLVVVTNRRWMQPYHSLEQGELGHRLEAAREHTFAFDLWLRALALYRSAFDGVFDWGDDLPTETVRALNVRADLLGLAGSSAKPTLAALLAGYYWNAFGLIRNLLETWRRAAFVRRRPEGAVPWFVLPDESPIGADGRPRKGRKSLTFATIQEAFKDATGDDMEIFDLVNVGIAHFHGGAHPSAEGMVTRADGCSTRPTIGICAPSA